MYKIELQIKRTMRILLSLSLILALSQCGEKSKNKKEGYYSCSMHPQIIQHEEGNCPICDMKLSYIDSSEEKQDEEQGSDSEGTKNFRFSLSKTVISNANLLTVPAKKEKFSREAKYSAHLDYNEGLNRLVVVSTKYEGWVERLFVSKEGQYVKKGQTLMAIYSPNILAAKEEYLTVFSTFKSILESQGKALAELHKDPTIKAARAKLINLDVPLARIRKLEKEGKVPHRTHYASPISGVVVKKNILQGAHIKAGEEVLRIANLSKLWAFFHIFEKDLAFIKKGQKAILHTQAYPDKAITAYIDLIYPFLDPDTKDIKVRIVVDNYKNTLKPGMFAKVKVIQELEGEHIVIPETAIIYSGEESYVFVSLGNNKFEIRQLQVSLSSDGKAIISSGLQENEVLVVNGQFLLASEASLKEAISKSNAEKHSNATHH